MFEIYNEIKSIEQVKKTEIFFYSVSKSEIINKDFKRIRKSLEILKKAEKEAKGKLYLTFDGYENDQREIYMISEIRDFVKTIWNEYKYLFYFLTELDNNRAVIFACINDFESYQYWNTGLVRLKIVRNEEIKNQTIEAMRKFGEFIDDSEEMQRVIFTII